MARVENKAMRDRRPLTRDPDQAADTRTDKPTAPAKPKLKQKIDALTRQRVVDLYYLSRRSVTRIGSETGLSVKQVWTVLRQWRSGRQDGFQTGWTRDSEATALPPAGTGPRRDDSRHDPLYQARLDLLLEAGLPPEEIATRMGISEAEAWRAFGTWCRVPQESGNGSTKPDAFYRLRHARAVHLFGQSLTTAAVADCLGVTPATLKRDERLVEDMGRQKR